MADTHQALGQDTQPEALHERLPIQGECFVPFPVPVLIHAERHRLVVHFQQPSIGDGDADGCSGPGCG